MWWLGELQLSCVWSGGMGESTITGSRACRLPVHRAQKKGPPDLGLSAPYRRLKSLALRAMASELEIIPVATLRQVIQANSGGTMFSSGCASWDTEQSGHNLPTHAHPMSRR